ncbi:MAG: hypothetical protein BWY68_00061 [bacterium ADurb.Bin400]|nr:MAG: hypothetical protein BWY68_00061 [bacterium ADurb.Bin400]
MTHPKDIGSFIRRGSSYISSQQKRDGSFVTFASRDSVNFSNPIECPSAFASYLILLALHDICHPRLTKAKDRALDFLLNQASKHWSFNYWARSSDQAKSQPYPDDLDDTSCALAALMKYKAELVTGEVMASLVRLLTSVESKEGGPYATWLVPPSSPKVWRDVDLAVNCNIAYLLSLHDISMESINAMVEEAASLDSYCSSYYPSCFPIIYFISRFYQGEKKDHIVRFLLSRQNQDGSWGNYLDSSLAVSALLNFGYQGDLTNCIEFLLKLNIADPPAIPFYVGANPTQDGNNYYDGSPALTAAMCVEALNKYSRQSTVLSGQLKVANHTKVIQKRILELANKRAEWSGKELGGELNKLTNDLANSRNGEQILLLPDIFNKCISAPTTDESMIVSLGLANLYGWIAYTVYDDFLDDEGQSKLLPLANLCLRELTAIYATLLPKSTEMAKVFRRIMDGIDKANEWEIRSCRSELSRDRLILPDSLPDYSDRSVLSDRSLGHALGPLAILLEQGYLESSLEFKSTLSFFQHYIIAKQLNDDAHDWEVDLKRGHLSYAVVLILALWKQRHQQRKTVSFTNDWQELESIFWHEVIDEICVTALEHLRLASRSLQENRILANSAPLERLLKPIEDSTKQAITEKRKATDFINCYANG